MTPAAKTRASPASVYLDLEPYKHLHKHPPDSPAPAVDDPDTLVAPLAPSQDTPLLFSGTHAAGIAEIPPPQPPPPLSTAPPAGTPAAAFAPLAVARDLKLPVAPASLSVPPPAPGAAAATTTTTTTTATYASVAVAVGGGGSSTDANNNNNNNNTNTAAVAVPVADEEAGAVTAPAPATAAAAARSESFGYLMMFLSTFGYSSMTLLLRAAEARFAVPALSAVLLRAVIQTALAVFSLGRAARSSRAARAAVAGSFAGTTKRALLALRGLLGALSMAALFGALALIPAGDASAIYFVSPIFTLLLARRLLGEPVSRVAAGAAVASFVGTALVTRPGTGAVAGVAAGARLVGSLLALASAALSACVYVLVRRLGTSVHYMVSVLALGVGALVVAVAGGGASPAALRGMVADGGAAGVALVLASAFAGFVGQMFWNRGLQHCPAGPGALIRNIDVPLVYALAMAILGETPQVGRVLGALLVVGSATAVGLEKVLRGNNGQST